MSWEIIWKAIKEPLRLLVLAIIPILLAYFDTLSYEWAVIITVFLRFVDKLLHEIGKESEDSKLITGLTRF